MNNNPIPDGYVRRSFPNILKPKIVDKFSDEDMDDSIIASSSFNQTYQPHIWAVQKDDIYSSIYAIEIGIRWLEDNIKIKMKNGDFSYIAENMKIELDIMKSTLKKLKSYDGSAEIYKNTQ